MKALGIIWVLAATAIMSASDPPRPYLISTYAGSSYAGDGGSAVNAVVLQPEGVAVDAMGNVVIADAADHRIRRVTPDGVIRTIAGDGSPGFRGDDGPASMARLNSPYGLCIDSTGAIYFADLANARVRMIGPDGTITTVAGGGTLVPGLDSEGSPAKAIKLMSPRNVAVDRDGNLYISDFAANRVYKVSPQGMFSIVAGTGDPGHSGDFGVPILAKLANPAGLATDSRGTLYIADSGNKRVRQIQQGVITTLSGSGTFAGALQFGSPTGITVDQVNNVYVVDGTPKATRISPQGAVSTVDIGGGDITIDRKGRIFVSAARQVKVSDWVNMTVYAGNGAASMPSEDAAAARARLSAPVAVAFDPFGSLIFGESGRLRRVTSQGSLSTLATFDNINGLAVDPWGTTYVSDTRANRVYKLSNGVTTRFAGTGDSGYGGDGGAGDRALLANPRGLAADSAGNVYVADTGNGRLRVISKAGVITLLAGGGTNPEDGRAFSTKIADPIGIALDNKNNVWFTEGATGRVKMLDRASGKIRTVAATDLKNPNGIRIGSAGEIIVADTGNHRIVRVTPEGQVFRIAGGDAQGFDGDDGPAAAGLLNSPLDIVQSADGCLYVADSANNRIRKLTPFTPAGGNTPEPLTVLHAATLRQQALAPGQIVTLMGKGLGPQVAETGKLNASGELASEVGETVASFDGIPAPLFYVSDTQINTVVPAALAGKNKVQVTVTHKKQVAATAEVTLTSAAPGLVTLAGGIGPVVALNQDNSVNGSERPAVHGSIVTLYATGEGALSGRAQEVTVDVAGFNAEILYAGPAPGFLGLMQLNVRVPSGFVPSGILPITLRVNGVASQAGVTLAVR